MRHSSALHALRTSLKRSALCHILKPMPNRPFDPNRIAGDMLTRLRAGANEQRRRHTAGYFPTSMQILGVSVPVMRGVAKEYARGLRDQTREELLALAHALIATATHEGRQTAYELIAARRDVADTLDPDDIGALGEGNDNWASVDAFAVLVAGTAWRKGRVDDAEVMRWALSADVWWRRTALVSTIPLNARSRGGTGDPVRTLRICHALVADRHPMVVKALSWALRELIAHDRAAVEAFILAEDVAPLVRREVQNKLRTGTKSAR
jgi:3-methyladenine DNA glycosylase AlkD